MVEGPKVFRKAQHMKMFLIGQKLLKYLNLSLFELNIDQPYEIIRILAVGKELFLILNAIVHIRLHFGMSGSDYYVCNVVDLDSFNPFSLLRHKHSRKVFTGALQFSVHTLFLFDCTVEVRRDNYINQIESRITRDVMSETFSIDDVVELLQKDTRSLMESLLDQNIMPGVGNVIKCEGLFRTQLNPSLITSNIPSNILKKLVQNLVDFSREWFHCCNKNKDVKKCIYGRQYCFNCNNLISLIRDANSRRITYYCSKCQPYYEDQNQLIEFYNYIHSLTHCHVKENVIIQMNESNAEKKQRIDDVKRKQSELFNWLLYDQPICGGNESSRAHQLNLLLSTVIQYDTGHSLPMTNQSPSLLCFTGQNSMEYDIIHSRSNTLVQSNNSQSILDIANLQTTAVNNSCQYSNIQNEKNNFPHMNQPLCACKMTCLLNRVRKNGPTHGRLFWSCSRQRNRYTQSCNFFQWADLLFPKCSHNEISLLRRVLKPGFNNGKYFFCCGKDPTNQCGFFSWVSLSSSNSINMTTSSLNKSTTIEYENINYTIPL
jgi:formamidopyrimidine-DNA glycosylase